MSDPAVTAYLTKLLCSHGGRLEKARLADLLELSEGQIEQILEDERLRFAQSSHLVLAQSAIRICTQYLHPEGEEDEDTCPKLHLCRHYLRGHCPPNRRPHCRFSHDVHSDHNRAVLKANELSGLNEDEIKVLLFQNDNQLLPEECRNYRKGDCDQEENCSRLHVCGYYIRGQCNSRFCKRSHDLLKSNVLFNCSWLSRKTIENFHMLCVLKHIDRHQAPRGEPRNEAPRGARGMSRGRGRGRPGYRRRAGSQDLLESRERRNEGSQYRWRSGSRPPSQSNMGHQSGDEGLNDRRGNSRPPSQCSVGHQSEDEVYNNRRGRSRPPSQCSTGLQSEDEVYNHRRGRSRPPSQCSTGRQSEDEVYSNRRGRSRPPSQYSVGRQSEDDIYNNRHGRSRPPSQCSVGRRSGDEGYNDSDSSSDHGRYSKTKLNDLMDDWFASSTSQPRKVRPSDGFTPIEGTRSRPVTKSSAESTKVNKPVMSQNAAQQLEPLNSRPSSEHTASNDPALIFKYNKGNVQTSYPRVSSTLTLSNDSEISVSKKMSTPNQKTEIDTNKALSSSMAKLSIAPSTPSKLFSTTRSSSMTQPNSATPTDSGHTASSSSSPFNHLARADVSTRKSQTSVKPITQTETESAQYVLSEEDLDFVMLTRKTTNYTATQHPSATNISSISPGKSSMEQTTEICHANLWKYCNQGGTCTKMHYCLPYRWQVFNGTDWDDLSNMEDIERAFCDPKIDRYHLIDFQSMTSSFKPVRRLTTPSSVTQPPEHALATEWLWYWMNENGIWTEYGKLSTDGNSATIHSSDLESIYLSDPTGTIPLRIGYQNYYIDCKEMKQKNAFLQTEREVRRRPRFLNYQNIQMLRGSTKSAADSLMLTQPDSNPITTTYTTSRDMDVQKIMYRKILLSQNSAEFITLVTMFSKTMSDYTVKNIWKVQNPILLERYNRQKEQMMRKNLSIPVVERQLFFTTYQSYIDAICREGFDWCICGTNGGEYGQGIHFTRDALSAHKYCLPGSTERRVMFVSRVLVGDVIQGNPALRHPPVKYGSERYDSCVDNVYNPTVFVVFEKQQVYPEFIISYEEKNTCRVH